MRPIRLAMIGGGPDAFIGGVHRMAARLDGHFALVAGAFSSDPEKSASMAGELNLDPERCYPDFATMAASEAAREDGAEAVAIVAPNQVHFDAAMACLDKGLPVICDKPLTTDLGKAKRLADAVSRTGIPFFVTYNYSGYPLVRQMREMVSEGVLGTIRGVHVEYVQDWLAEPIEQSGQKQAGWRTDPVATGGAGATGDIATHAYHLMRFVSGLRVEELGADLSSLVPGRVVDDDARILLRLEGGARGMLWASQIAHGNTNGLRLRIFGEEGGLEWHQQNPEELTFAARGQPPQIVRRGGPEAEAAGSRLPPGHPEGFVEAFGTLYCEAAEGIRAWQAGGPGNSASVPGIDDGVEGVAFVDAVLRSSANNAAWTKIEEHPNG
ncbi:MAG: Gfo/Idh/MocA family oxidoreductase [Erythrobacter sp.]|uniref:Gfo/Idh/MocA family protein n=1 Tax=Erythrobacter sp. TaxID=1042 RepID=UPI00261826B4|nr:Gfo/Idh/MocA family oxidoreductase [Erythrobacter sp.]MDJ0978167.1 Gfo/Idh/MocA family oxidoreductase [Erythrobacter sp.]